MLIAITIFARRLCLFTGLCLFVRRICILVKLWIHFHKCLWEGWAKGPTDYLDFVCYSIAQLLVKSGYALVMILPPRRLCTL